LASATGPAASLGIPEKNTIALCTKSVAGKTIEYILLDDATDTTTAAAATADAANAAVPITNARRDRRGARARSAATALVSRARASASSVVSASGVSETNTMRPERFSFTQVTKALRTMVSSHAFGESPRQSSKPR